LTVTALGRQMHRRDEWLNDRTMLGIYGAGPPQPRQPSSISLEYTAI